MVQFARRETGKSFLILITEGGMSSKGGAAVGGELGGRQIRVVGSLAVGTFVTLALEQAIPTLTVLVSSNRDALEKRGHDVSEFIVANLNNV